MASNWFNLAVSAFLLAGPVDLMVCMCAHACVRWTHLRILQTARMGWTWGRQLFLGLQPDCSLQFCLHMTVASCFIRYFCCPIFSLTSPAAGSLWVPALALLWQSVRGGDPCVIPVFSSHNQHKDGQVGPSARLLFIMGIIKDPECFHWLMRDAPCTCRANINIRRVATKTTKTPNLLPQMKLYFSCVFWIQFCIQLKRKEKLLSISSILANLNNTPPAGGASWREGSWGHLLLLTAKSSSWATTHYPFCYTGLGMLVLKTSRPLHQGSEFSAWTPPCTAQKNSSC